MNLTNNTFLTAAPVLLADHRGAETLVVIAKGTWRICPDASLVAAEEQVPIHFRPVYRGEPGKSSLIYDTDVLLEKPGTDCLLIGHAWAPKSGICSVDVEFNVGTVRKSVRVFGDRFWEKGRWKTFVSKPLPFESIPLLWERAFGGVDMSWLDPTGHEFCLENPVGQGLLARKTEMQVEGMRLPNLEDPSCLINKVSDHPKAVGFGPIPPQWQPRAGYGGTYDDHWRKHRSPLPPEDLDRRFYSSAAPGMATPQPLAGTETICIENGAKQGRLQFVLPGVRPRVIVRTGGADEALTMTLDTLTVEPDEARLVLVWRGKRTFRRSLHEVDRITVGLP
jgi:hypothetical protein